MSTRILILFSMVAATGCTHWQKTSRLHESRVLEVEPMSEPYASEGRGSCRQAARVSHEEVHLVDYEPKGVQSDMMLAAGFFAGAFALGFLGQPKFLSFAGVDPVRDGKADPVMLVGSGVLAAAGLTVTGIAIFKGQRNRAPAAHYERRIVKRFETVDAATCHAETVEPSVAWRVDGGRMLTALDSALRPTSSLEH